MRRLCLLLLLLPALAACQWMTEDYDEDDWANMGFPQYINITVSVTAGNNPFTRAYPNGGEYGDGVELGIEERENYVEKITVIFYQDNTGINTTDGDAEVSFVKTYDVHRASADDYPYTHTHDSDEPVGYAEKEIIYTTGEQKLEETQLVVGQSYKVLVVANADINVAPGTKIHALRDMLLDNIYTGSGLGIDASKFVMTSENDATITLANPTVKEDENKVIFYFECIHIDRMAARIDYCTKGAEYSEEYHGFVYQKTRGHGPNQHKDLYVVTKVTPFNLYNEPEYLFKRVRNSWGEGTPVITYLGDETTVNNIASNYVVDPFTANKLNGDAETISYSNLLTSLVPAPGNPGNPGNPNDDSNPYSQVMEDVHLTSSLTDHSGFNNIVIAYPRENTLLPGSLLKKYATGIVFEVDVYLNFNPNAPNPPRPEKRKYYHYLRHQGELFGDIHTYAAERLEKPKVDGDRETCYVGHGHGHGPGPGAGDAVLVPMRCGIVRNNIYRVSVTGFSDEDGTIILTIEEEKWRHVDNPRIYI